MRYILIPKFSELSGYSIAAIESKIQRGEWLEGIHYVKSPDNRRWIDTEEIESWITGGLKSVAKASASRSSTRASAAGRL